MSNMLSKSSVLVVKVRCVICKWEGLRTVKRMKHALDQGCKLCGHPVEFVSAVRRAKSVTLGRGLKKLTKEL